MALMEQPFYHKTIRLYTSVFGNLFNDIKIVRDDGKVIKVPLAYAAQQKYNVRLEQDEDPDLIRYMKRTPRMSFVLTGWQRDISRVKNKLHRLTNHDVVNLSDPQNTGVSAQYNRVPYTFNFRLDATAKYMDDLLQIFEQIAVSFNPALQVVVKDNPDLSDESALTITLLDSAAEDTFEGVYETGREITMSFNFNLDGYLYMPTSDSSVIKKVYVNYYDLDSPDVMIDQQIFTEEDAL